MSAQCYTNKRRILAEASLRKTQYPGSVGLNNNPIYASINCKPDFSKLVYLIKVCCIKRKTNILPTEEILLILGGGGASSFSTSIVSGGGASTIATEIISGGNASGTAFGDNNSDIVSGGGASSVSTAIVSGGGASTMATEIVSGGNSSTT